MSCLAAGRAPPARLRFQAQPTDKAVVHLLCSPDGRRLAAYDEGERVHLLDTATGQVVYTLSGVPAVSCLAFNRTGDELVCGNSLRKVVIRNAATGEVQRHTAGDAGGGGGGGRLNDWVVRIGS